MRSWQISLSSLSSFSSHSPFSISRHFTTSQTNSSHFTLKHFAKNKQFYCTTQPKPPKEKPKKKRTRRPNAYWNDIANQRDFFDNLEKKLNITSKEQWGDITLDKFVNNGGGSLIVSRYRGNYRKALQTVYPDVEWRQIFNKRFQNRRGNIRGPKRTKVWKRIAASLLESRKFTSKFPPPPDYAPREYTQYELEMRSKLIDFYRNRALTSYEDFYSLHYQLIPRSIAQPLKTKFKRFSDAVVALFPELPFRFYLFRTCAFANWKIRENQQIYLDDLFNELKLNTMEDWYSVTASDVLSLGGGSLLRIYKTFFNALKGVYRNYPWEDYKVRYLPLDLLDTLEKQANFLENIKKKLNIKTPEDWYRIRTKDLVMAGGRKMLNLYRGSLPRMLITVYPNIKWNFLNSKCKKAGLVYQNEYFRSLMTGIRRQMNVRQPSDWLRISNRAIYSIYSIKLLGSKMLVSLLRKNYPDQFPASLLRSERYPMRKFNQRHLYNIVSQLCKQHLILEDYTFTTFVSYLQFDLFIPALNIAFEYQGEQHYHDLRSSFGFSDLYLQKDIEKIKYAEENGIYLIIVPYWWDLTPDPIIYLLNSIRLDKYFYKYPIPRPEVLCIHTRQPVDELFSCDPYFNIAE